MYNIKYVYTRVCVWGKYLKREPLGITDEASFLIKKMCAWSAPAFVRVLLFFRFLFLVLFWMYEMRVYYFGERACNNKQKNSQEKLIKKESGFCVCLCVKCVLSSHHVCVCACVVFYITPHALPLTHRRRRRQKRTTQHKTFFVFFVHRPECGRTTRWT